jgi:hypothetical protein
MFHTSLFVTFYGNGFAVNGQSAVTNKEYLSHIGFDIFFGMGASAETSEETRKAASNSK